MYFMLYPLLMLNVLDTISYMQQHGKERNQELDFLLLPTLFWIWALFRVYKYNSYSIFLN